MTSEFPAEFVFPFLFSTYSPHTVSVSLLALLSLFSVALQNQMKKFILQEQVSQGRSMTILGNCAGFNLRLAHSLETSGQTAPFWSNDK